MSTTTREALAAALRYAERGWRSFPIAAPDPRLRGDAAVFHSKLPRSLTALRRASARPRELEALFAGPECSNVGIATGPESGLVVLDVDFVHGGEASLARLALPATLTARSPGGVHLYFAHPGVAMPNARHALGPGVDVNGDRSFTTAPPSTHASGVRYAWQDLAAPLAALPDDVVRRLRATPTLPRWRRLGRYLLCRYGQRPASLIRAAARRR